MVLNSGRGILYPILTGHQHHQHGGARIAGAAHDSRTDKEDGQHIDRAGHGAYVGTSHFNDFRLGTQPGQKEWGT
jgi:hypothetical protein